MKEKLNTQVHFYGVDFRVYFDYSPGSPETLEQPKEDEEIEILSVVGPNGKELLDELTEKEYANIKNELWKSR